MKIERCEKCGQIIPPANPFLPQRPRKALIYDFISAHPEGVTRAQVAAFVWKDDRGGGPDRALDIISMHIAQMNVTLPTKGLYISSTKGHGAVYRLKMVPLK
jgi:hypothetical protein